jgi:CO/xanthine dehydrogenase FAD-binding subunit
MSTALPPEEIIVAARFPRSAPGERYAYLQFSRRTGDFALVAVAVVLSSKGLRVGIGGVEDRPVVLQNIESRDAAEIAAAARAATHPTETPRVPAVFRSELVEVLTRRAVQKCSSSN